MLRTYSNVISSSFVKDAGGNIYVARNFHFYFRSTLRFRSLASNRNASLSRDFFSIYGNGRESFLVALQVIGRYTRVTGFPFLTGFRPDRTRASLSNLRSEMFRFQLGGRSIRPVLS